MEDNKQVAIIIQSFTEIFKKNINNDFFDILFSKKYNQSELSKLIDKYLIPQENEKKQNAEVSTPYELRKEMLDKIPIDFWESPKRVFEPCCGKGGFLIDIIGRFMVGLKDKIKDDNDRYEFIISECLYYSDINECNIIHYICNI